MKRTIARDTGVLIESLMRTKGSDGKLSAFLEWLAPFGISHAHYAAGTIPVDFTSEALVLSNHPERFRDVYEAEHLIDHDFLVKAVCRSTCAVRWRSDHLLASLTPQERYLSDIAADFGLRDGLTLSAREPASGVIGGVSLNPVAMPRDEFDAVLKEFQGILHLAAMLFHNAVHPLTPSASPAILTARERECLLGATLGETSEDTADRLLVSRSAIEKHLANARAKLRAHTLPQAVAKGLIAGHFEIQS